MIGLVHRHAQFTACLSLAEGKYWLQQFADQPMQDNESTYEGPTFRGLSGLAVRCSVRDDGVMVSCNGKRLVDWKGDYSQFNNRPLALVEIPDKRCFFLASWVNYRITDCRLIPVAAPVGQSTTRPARSENKPVQLRIFISKDGECRILLGRGVSEDPKQPVDHLVPITDWLSSRPSPNSKNDAERGSLLVRSSDPKQSRGMLLYPRAFRFPCTLSLDITEFRDADLGVQFISTSSHLTVHIMSEDGLRANARLRATCGNLGANQHATRIERTVQLDRPNEVRFQLPLTQEQLAQLMTLDAPFFPTKKDGPPPSGTISNVILRAQRDRPLGIGLKVEQSQVVVERVAPDGLAAAAGIEVGDVLIAQNGNRFSFCEDSSQLPGIAFGMVLGPEVRLTFRRGGKERTVTINYG
jgi:hypothetical protein